jgi:hypothetical protein
MLVLRLADGSGGVDVVAWGQAADRVLKASLKSVSLSWDNTQA